VQLTEGVLIVSATDLVGFLNCDHLATLELGRARGEWGKPVRFDPEIELMQERGYAHEQAYLERLRIEGRTIHEIATGELRTPAQLAEAEAETAAAMQAGRDVIYQATFFDGRWRGHADFLLRVERQSDLGEWSYEIADTKLSRTVKANAIIQMCVYADGLARLQGAPPARVHVVTGDGLAHPYRLADYAAYYRAVKGRFEATFFGEVPGTIGRADTYPEPVEHCRVCSWWPMCIDRRRTDDHLSLVAGMTRAQTTKLRDAGIPTLAALGESPPGSPVPDMSQKPLERIRHQARLQLEGRRSGTRRYELIDPDPAMPGAGLASLPIASPLDVFFDIEADPWALEGGIEYLLGWLEEVDGRGVYHAIWGHDAEAERRAFEAFIDLVTDRLARDPAMHVYHYAAYEPVAIKRLMNRYATREDDVDRLLRGGVFVDLYQAVRHGIRASVESYSIKQIEKFYMPVREGGVTDAGFSVVQYETWLKSREQRLLDELEAYNRDDCLSTWLLRAWLEERRLEAEARFGVVLPRPAPQSGEAPAHVAEAQAETQARVDRLMAGLPAGRADRDDLEQGRWLLAQLLDWHRRDSKPAWWEFYRLREIPVEDLVAESGALAGLEFVGVVESDRFGSVYRYRFDPAQDYRIREGDTDWVDPSTGKGAGTVVRLDEVLGHIELRRGRQSSAPHPVALIESGPLNQRVMRDGLGRVADWVIENRLDGPGRYRAVRELVLKHAPRIVGVTAGQRLVWDGEDPVVAARRIAGALDETVLPIQGPPGTGKTFTGARMIVEIIRAGKRVGITAQAHKAITNLIVAVDEAAREAGIGYRAIQRCDTDDHAGHLPSVTIAKDNEEVERGLRDEAFEIAAGTTWLMAREQMDGLLDVLVVDEAGQMSLANVVSMGGAARSIVLLGDPNQLPQVSQGVHPEGAERSALEHLVGEETTIAPDRGILLDTTFRLHPALNAYISEVFYEDRLRSHPSTSRVSIDAPPGIGGVGIAWLPVRHELDQSRSRDEAARVAETIARLRGHAWVDAAGSRRALELDEILVVAPYNAHVAEIHKAVEAAVGERGRVGTVDKFQGQEGAVSIYSMATSSPEDAPRGMDFLYSGNRLNVAISRARGLAILVCSPELLAVSCRTPEQMRLANAFCRLVEVARVVTP
jgi:uncharacterized protein